MGACGCLTAYEHKILKLGKSKYKIRQWTIKRPGHHLGLSY